jgi:uncharacterized membrane protein YkvA (DUF1232 family)
VRGLILALAISFGVWALAVATLVLAGKRVAARELAALIPNLLRLFRGLLRDPRVPRRTKLLLLLAAAWIASPVDLVPEFIPVAGPLDDAIVAALVLRRVVRAAGPQVVAEHWRGEAATLDTILKLAGASR